MWRENYEERFTKTGTGQIQQGYTMDIQYIKNENIA